MLFAEEVTQQHPLLHVCTDVGELERWEKILQWCARRRRFAFDTETSGFYWFRDSRTIGYVAGYDLDDGVGPRGVYFPIRHFTTDKQLPAAAVIEMFGRLLGDPENHVIGHNLPFDVHFAEADGIVVRATLHDTQVMSNLVDERVPRDLEGLIDHYALDPQPYYWKERTKEVHRLVCKRRDIKVSEAPGYALIPVGVLGPYGANDGRFTLLLAQRLLPFVDAYWSGQYALERSLMPVLIKAERRGMLVDVDGVHRLHAKCVGEVDRLRTEIQRLARYDLNPRNDDDVAELIYSRLGNPVRFTTESVTYGENGEEYRKPSVDAVALRDVVHRTSSPLVKLLLDFREVDKIRSTYTTPLLEFVDDRGYLHGRLDQTGTKTGRLASKDPNLQNFPSDKSAGVRDLFLVPHGLISVFMDFSQVELRVLAFLSREPTLWAAFINGEDVHAATSLRMFGKATSDNRRVAKVINFGVAYGMSKYGVRDNLNKNADPERGIPTIDDDKAEAYLAQWHSLFPRVSQWSDELCAAMMHTNPPSYTNMFGRTRRISELRSPERHIKRRGKRMAVASMVQGSAAILAKIALVRTDALCEWGRERGYFDAHVITNVHDDIRTDVNRDGAPYFASLAKAEMERWPEFAPIPITVDGEWSSTTWAEKTKIWPKEK